jgi:hypothetical protein
VTEDGAVTEDNVLLWPLLFDGKLQTDANSLRGGYGYGDGRGNGYGYGDGRGNGYGYGDGSGSGNGDG